MNIFRRSIKWKLCVYGNPYLGFHHSDVVWKLALLKVPQSSQEKQLGWSFWVKLHAKSATLLMKFLHRNCYLWVLINFVEQFLYRTPPADCFCVFFAICWFFYCLIVSCSVGSWFVSKTFPSICNGYNI